VIGDVTDLQLAERAERVETTAEESRLAGILTSPRG
jgi:hypothetical protein